MTHIIRKCEVYKYVDDLDCCNYCRFFSRKSSEHTVRYKSKTLERPKVRREHTILTAAIDCDDSVRIQRILDDMSRGYINLTIIDHVCSNGRTALWYACKKGNLDLVRQLVEHRSAKINKCGILIVAAQNAHKKVVNYLLGNGCDPNRDAKNYNERALHAASRRNHLSIVNALLMHGADPTIYDYKRRTALDYAIHKRHNDIAKVLIYHQGGKFIMSQTGFTPLMLAVHCNNTPIGDLLMDILSRQQVLDELVLLACKYTIDDVMNKRDQAYSYFEKALSVSASLCNTELCEAHELLSECQTLDELASIRKNIKKCTCIEKYILDYFRCV
jgi:ankyrin repeat protein